MHPMDVPLMQEMRTDLSDLSGVVVRQETQVLDAVAATAGWFGLAGSCYAPENTFKISALPDGRKVALHPDDAGAWAPTGRDGVFYCMHVCASLLVAHRRGARGAARALQGAGGFVPHLQVRLPPLAHSRAVRSRMPDRCRRMLLALAGCLNLRSMRLDLSERGVLR